MSRRHFSATAPPPSAPFEQNLMFYAPMTFGDLTDHISGSTGGPVFDTRSDNLTYSSSVGAYIVHARTFRENPIVWSTPNRKTMWGDSDSWTQIYDIRKIDDCVYGVISGYADQNSSTFNYSVGYPYSHIASYQSYLSTTSFKTVVISTSYDIHKSYTYIDGVFISERNWNADSAAYVKGDGAMQRVSFGSSIGGDYVTHGYVKNILLYNRYFSQSEIQTIVDYYHNQ